MKRYSFYFSITFLVFVYSALFVSGCKKPEEEIANEDEYKITTNLEHVLVQVHDTVVVNYEVSGPYFSVAKLIVDDSVVVDTSSKLRGEFRVIFDTVGYHEAYIEASFGNGMKAYSKKKGINVKDLVRPNFWLTCVLHDGNDVCFVGDSVFILIKPSYPDYSLDLYKSATLYLNGDSLGTATEVPFTFDPGVIEQGNNDVRIVFVDTLGFPFTEYRNLSLPENTPPHIELTKPFGLIHSYDSVKINVYTSDNILVDYINFYLDDEPYKTEVINGNYINYDLNIGVLPVGTHTFNCVVYDDRGDSTASGKLYFKVYRTYEMTEDVFAVEKSLNDDLFFLVTKTQLFVFNNGDDSKEVYDMPLVNPSALDFVNENNRLYIAFKDGHLIYFDLATQIFETVIGSGFSNIDDMKIDYDDNLAVVIHQHRVVTVDLTSHATANAYQNLDVSATLDIDRVNNRIVAGGDQHFSLPNIYSYHYGNDSIKLINSISKSGNIDKLLMNPGNNNRFVIDMGGYFEVYNLQTLQYVSEFKPDDATAGCYSSTGAYFYTGVDYYTGILSKFNTSDFTSTQLCNVPIKRTVEYMISNKNDSQLMIVVDPGYYLPIEIVFTKID